LPEQIVGEDQIRELRTNLEQILQVLTKLEKDEGIDSAPTFGQRIADKAVRFIGSWTFIIVQDLLIVAYLFFNSIGWTGSLHFDRFPFEFFGLLLSIVAANLVALILISQNRAEQKDRKRSIEAYRIVIDVHKKLHEVHTTIIGKSDETQTQ